MDLRFNQVKQAVLAKKDKSTKGVVDERIKLLLDVLNAQENYYTTSSCSGRIVLLHGEHKRTATFLYCSHDPVQEVPQISFPKTGLVWLKCEGAILHVACKTLEAASVLLKAAQTTGFKHSGLISFEPKIVVEIKSAEYLAVPLCKDGQLLTGSLDQFLAIANEKLHKNFRMLDALIKCAVSESELHILSQQSLYTLFV